MMCVLVHCSEDSETEEGDAQAVNGAGSAVHPVTSLQELCQKNGLRPPDYAFGVESTRGAQTPMPTPNPHVFYATVSVSHQLTNSLTNCHSH